MCNKARINKFCDVAVHCSTCPLPNITVELGELGVQVDDGLVGLILDLLDLCYLTARECVCESDRGVRQRE